MNKRAALAHRDLEGLMNDDRFLRFVFTILQSSGIWHPAYGTDGRHLAHSEGRRSLGFDILSSAEQVRPDALLAFLQAEHQAQTEYPDAKPRQSRTVEDDAEGPPGSDGRNTAGAGLVNFLDYSGESAE